jgi:hypothetical protein
LAFRLLSSFYARNMSPPCPSPSASTDAAVRSCSRCCYWRCRPSRSQRQLGTRSMR